ncbi:hypothetical protein GALMADRAFT_765792 [Galerina marginata CBS 339.88]|uniref:Uncharacterized protein n=1 Tax=Galerina marginata (strain CBS 339.88) TaxID=685588 RepID=A0A067SWW3_GALM3|nr:hypothetical protein GALMADRAFT_765792 [Galerina marginata CBS 339.88]
MWALVRCPPLQHVRATPTREIRLRHRRRLGSPRLLFVWSTGTPFVEQRNEVTRTAETTGIVETAVRVSTDSLRPGTFPFALRASTLL